MGALNETSKSPYKLCPKLPTSQSILHTDNISSHSSAVMPPKLINGNLPLHSEHLRKKSLHHHRPSSNPNLSVLVPDNLSSNSALPAPVPHMRFQSNSVRVEE
jgi:hypothetical protein